MTASAKGEGWGKKKIIIIVIIICFFLAHVDVFQKNEKKNKTTLCYTGRFATKSLILAQRWNSVATLCCAKKVKSSLRIVPCYISFKPLSPDVPILRILQTDLHTFLYTLENWLRKINKRPKHFISLSSFLLASTIMIYTYSNGGAWHKFGYES